MDPGFRNSRDEIRGPDGALLRGKPRGYVDKEGRVRNPDGILIRGDQIGEIDKQGNVRTNPGVLFKGKQVGVVEGSSFRGPDGAIFQGEQYGYVDDQGNIRQKDGVIFRGRIIGQVRGSNPARALAFFALRFEELCERYRQLKSLIGNDRDKGRHIGKIRFLLKSVSTADAIGDFETLIRNLETLEKLASESIVQNTSRRRNLCAEAQRVSYMEDWRAGAEQIKNLQSAWKEAGFVPEGEGDLLYQAFRESIERFFVRRKKYFEEIDRVRSDNLRAKENICQMIENLSTRDWKEASVSCKALQAKWRDIGQVPKDKLQGLSARYRSAIDRFYRERNEHYAAQQKEWEARKAERERKQREWEARKAERERKQREWEARKAERERKQREWEARKAERERKQREWEARKAERERKQREWEARKAERARRQAEWEAKKAERQREWEARKRRR